MRRSYRKLQAQRGATTAEYSLIVALLNVALIATLVFMQSASYSQFEELSSLDGSEATR